MPTNAEIEKLSLIDLAVLCKKVADDPTHYTKEAAGKALDLKREWVILQTEPHPDLREEQRRQAQLESLQKRMVEFLVGIL